MDKETVANHISGLGKYDFEIACRLVLTKVFSQNAVNVDGSNDGGTDFSSFSSQGQRTNVAYQITTQKSDIKNKAYNDARKSLEKLGVDEFFFMCSYALSEEKSRELERLISKELNIRTTVLTPNVIAGFLINHELLGEFLDEVGVSDIRTVNDHSLDYRQMALHSYTLFSSESKNLKDNIYDDSLMIVLDQEPQGLSREDLVAKTIELLSLPERKCDILQRRIDSLLSKSIVEKDKEKDMFLLSAEAKKDMTMRNLLYQRELSSLSSAQADLLQEYNIEWTDEDAIQVSVWLANIILQDQIKTLKTLDAPLARNFCNRFGENDKEKLKKLLKKKKLPYDKIDNVVNEFLDLATAQPLMKKISSAFVYVSLEGKNPLTSCRALGVKKWSDFKLLVEPTIGIPLLLSFFFNISDEKYYYNTLLSIEKVKELGIPMFINANYIKECAGHLHMARKYCDLELDENEMVYSNNAFVANYYRLKKQNVPVPNTLLDYLAILSPAIRNERDYKAWIRSIMADIQSLFTRRGSIEYVTFPMNSDEELEDIEYLFDDYLARNQIEKSRNLIHNDVVALKNVSDKNSTSENWMILTYDKTLIEVAKDLNPPVYVTTPLSFLDLLEMSKPMSEKQLSILVHSIAKSSEHTLIVGARILDQIILYASDKMQEWQFKQALDSFKIEMIKDIELDDKFDQNIKRRTVDFLKKQGVEVVSDEVTEEESETICSQTMSV